MPRMCAFHNRPFSLVDFVLLIQIMYRYLGESDWNLEVFIKKTACESKNVQLLVERKILFWVSSHDLHWENKIDKQKRRLETMVIPMDLFSL